MLLDCFDSLMSFSDNEKPFIYKNGHSASLHFDLTSVHSEMDVRAPYRLVLGYTQAMMGFLLFHDNPKSIAMIGLGGGSLPKYCYRYLPGASTIVLEKNESVIALRHHFCIPDDDTRLQVLCADGADFVKKAQRKFDVLIVDGFDKTGQPAQLCSQRFYDDCYNVLERDGIMVVNLLDNDVVTDIYLDRMHRSFDGAVTVIPAFDSENKIAFACRGAMLDLPNRALIKRVREIAADHTVDLYPVAQNILRQRRFNAITGYSAIQQSVSFK